MEFKSFSFSLLPMCKYLSREVNSLAKPECNLALPCNPPICSIACVIATIAPAAKLTHAGALASIETTTAEPLNKEKKENRLNLDSAVGSRQDLSKLLMLER